MDVRHSSWLNQTLNVKLCKFRKFHTCEVKNVATHCGVRCGAYTQHNRNLRTEAFRDHNESTQRILELSMNSVHKDGSHLAFGFCAEYHRRA